MSCRSTSPTFRDETGQTSASMQRIESMLSKIVLPPSPLSKTGLTAERVRQLTKNMR